MMRAYIKYVIAVTDDRHESFLRTSSWHKILVELLLQQERPLFVSCSGLLM
jgi:hypothetical protein